VTEYLTRAEAAVLLRVSVSTIDRRAKAGTLPVKRLDGGRAVRFRRVDVLALLTERN
jgi:excisionase family DNA binding protein